jgi:hypothetical protein
MDLELVVDGGGVQKGLAQSDGLICGGYQSRLVLVSPLRCKQFLDG